ncbi:MAG: hypothetical protein IPM24_18325 [Bryobacterales bacterium]|jgi:hypothetical protein|nr:hypothetical protein [Bryobacterales bacterium]
MPNPHNELFASKPLEFFKQNSVVPPSDGGQTQVDLKTLWQDTTGVVKYTSTDKVTEATIPDGQRVVWVNFERMGKDRNEAEALTFKVSLTPKADWVPIHFLPWRSMKVVHTTIPEIDEKDLGHAGDTNPHLFFTAAINGCSVFVTGSPRNPAVYHAGIDGTLSLNAVDFWRDRLDEIFASSGMGSPSYKEVNKSDYVKDDQFLDPRTTETAKRYEDWLRSHHSGEFGIQEVKPWGCVFGIRYGRLWSFYLQENATISYLRIVRKKDVVKKDVHGKTVLFEKDTGANIETMNFKKKFGLLTRKHTLYASVHRTSRPMIVREFYPSGNAKITVSDEYRAV